MEVAGSHEEMRPPAGDEAGHARCHRRRSGAAAKSLPDGELAERPHRRAGRDPPLPGLAVPEADRRYSARVFHRPRRKSSPLAIASVENAIVMARKTPCGPMRSGTAST